MDPPATLRQRTNNLNLSSRELVLKLYWLTIQSEIEFMITCITYTTLTTG